ncbi:MAG: multidrug efflux SMR transporter [Candidatus Caenarcaniphilales bacterium]|nr:multidrug efflux SMR transporter [Candidatus Caenarcaniphilales bacterium]
MSWLYLTAAILFEVVGTVSMKLSDGFTKLWPSVAIFVFYTLSFYFMVLCLKKLDVHLVYAVWAGLGTALISIVGFIWFKEPVSTVKILSIFLIIAGVIGLHLNSNN